jgi:hypothetical protein
MLHKEYDRKDSVEKVCGRVPEGALALRRTDWRETASREVTSALTL